LSPRVASAALAMLAARTESDAIFVGFTGRGTSYVGGYRKSRSGFSSPTKTPELSYLDITKKDRLDTVVDNMNGLPFGGTDCALPMVWAKKEKIAADAFIVLTDNETWAGSIQPSQALKQYRDSMGIPAKLVVVGMTATNFTIADPKDVGSMDVVGFDTTAPQIISQFIKGEI
jgi:60 kDa SS-A/Ro ribonucleoprotein